MNRAWCAAAGLLAGVCLVVGCAGPEKNGSSVERGPAPSFGEVAARYNARTADLERLWARTTVRYWGYNDQDERVDQAGEGYLQLVRPRRLFFSVGKVGEVGFELGSDDTRYWWIDVQERSAAVGEHARATPATLRRTGVPVHPLDLIEVLGVTPLEAVPDVGVSWTDDGTRLRVDTPGRWGGRRVLFLDGERYEPVEIRLLDASGETAVRAELSDYATVDMPRDRTGTPRVATRVMITVPSRRSEIRLTLYDPENKDIKTRSFSFDSLKLEYGVQRVRDLDADGPAPRGAGR